MDVSRNILNKKLEKFFSKRTQNFVKKSVNEQNVDFEKFLGFWQISSSCAFNNFLMEFYYDEDVMSIQYYTGTPLNWREYNNNDTSLRLFPSTVSMIDSNSVLINTVLIPPSSPEEPFITFRIQEDGSGFCYLFDAKGAGDTVGGDMWKCEKLEEEPVIQRNDQPSLVDWNNPVEMARYVYQAYGLLYGPQKANDLNDANYVGREQYDDNFQQLLTTGWTRTATTSSAFRGGKYIGVWKTQQPQIAPVTTLHTSEPHKFNEASVLEITGFSGPFSILNGAHKVSSVYTSTKNANPSYPWANSNSFEYQVMINVDTSGIVEEYNPLVHGYGFLQSFHAPITSDTEYRSMIASLLDFVITSFGECTHNFLRAWTINREIPDTFELLNAGLKDGSARFSTLRTRTYQSNGSSGFYNNYQVQGNSVTFPTMNINDPFGLGDVSDKPEFDIDIDVENYLQEDKRFNLFYTITGDPDSAPDVSNSLESFGYPSNGNQVVFQISPFQQVPPPLEDEWGSHPYFYYGTSGFSRTPPEVASHNGFVCGIVKKSKTKNCETIAYIRITDELGTDGAFLFAGYPTVFGVDGISNKGTGVETIAMATVLEELNKHKPSKYIIDTRRNVGGVSAFPNAFASLFGANRTNNTRAFTTPSDDSAPVQDIVESGYESGYNNLQMNRVIQSTINTDEIAALYPQSMVRSNDPKKKLQVVILTSTRSASGGDTLPHAFIDSNPTSTVHQLGFNVESTIINDINGRLDGGSSLGNTVAVDTLQPRLTNNSGQGITPIDLRAETHTSNSDGIGPFNNFTTQVIPDKLLETWYDNSQWRDIGLIKGKVQYPICGSLPKRFDNTTWRDYQLEEAIAHRTKKKSKCQCKNCKYRHHKKC